MADRYQNRPFPAEGYDRGGNQHASGGDESDPLAELARLIGQTDMGRIAPPPSQQRDEYQPPAEVNHGSAGPPPWLQRANRQELPREAAGEVSGYEMAEEANYQPGSVHPLHRYVVQQPASDQQYQDEPLYPEGDQERDASRQDPSRYDDALYGQIESGAQDYQRDPAYPDDPYAYQDDCEGEEEGGRKGRGRLVTVVAVLVLAVVGTGGALAYRTYAGSPRSFEPPIIKADNSPTKIVPPPSDGLTKVPDRMTSGEGTEKIVSREEAPMDVGKPGGAPRVVFPALNQNGNPPSVGSVTPSTIAAATAGSVPSNGTLPNNEPRKIRTFTVRGDQPDSAATPVNSAGPASAKTAAAAKSAAPRTPLSANANASSGAPAPLSLAPQADPAPPADAKTKVAIVNTPVQAAPAPPASGGGYLVQVSSQRSDADAQASFKALQSKFPAVLGSQSPVIKRADLGDKGVYYRAMVGPFGSSEEASQFCGNLKTAGGQCVVQRN
jgi:hypothetical protein